MYEHLNCLCEAMSRYIGQTVTIFTTSGGLSGSGFTGVLLSSDCNCVRLLCDIGAPPSCPIGSACTETYNSRGGEDNNYAFEGNPLGAICVIPATPTIYTQLRGACTRHISKPQIHGGIFPHNDTDILYPLNRTSHAL